MTTDACIQLTKNMEQQSRTGALAGFAGYLTRPIGGWIFSRQQGVSLPGDLRPILAVGPNLDLAEKSANKAMEAAQKVADARAAEQKKLNDEMASIEAAGTACTPNKTCEAKCKSGDGFSCVVVAVKLWHSNPPKLAEAKATMQKGCEAGVQRACNSVPQIDADIQQAAAQVEGLWGGVTEVGDDLAQKYHLVSVAQQVATPRLLMNVGSSSVP